mmetsp:Transcript_1109/g.1819  ORF Transcript_1109/g.1819 Transcript_1109/m.1819 type:complete len:224 (+) Transcript_1109:558-1229(+)
MVSSESSSTTTYLPDCWTYCFTTPRSPFRSEAFTSPLSDTTVPGGIASYGWGCGGAFADCLGIPPMPIPIPGGIPPMLPPMLLKLLLPMPSENIIERGSPPPAPPPKLLEKEAPPPGIPPIEDEKETFPGPPIPPMPPKIPPKGSLSPNILEKNACASSGLICCTPPPPPGWKPPNPPAGMLPSSMLSAAFAPSSPYMSYIFRFFGSERVAYASDIFWKFLVA